MDARTRSEKTTHYRVCNFCEAMCGVEVTYDPHASDVSKKITVKPDLKDPFSKGSMCPKAPVLGPLHFDQSRLKQPVKRSRDGWAQISWEEAYDTIEEKLKSIRSQHGPDAIATYLGNPIVHNLGMLLFVKTLTGAIGSRNVSSATSMDQLPHHFAAHFMFGHEFRIPVPDIDRTDHMILMGANPVASNGSIMTSAGVTERLRKIQKRGGKLIVIDPRKTETGKIASEHYFIKPGTDAYFLLAVLHIAFRDGLVRPGSIEPHLKNLEKLEPCLAAFAPDAVGPVTQMDARVIEKLASEFLTRDKAVIYGRMGLSTQPHGGLCQWLINTINIVSGNFDRPGGMMFPSPAIELARDKVQPDTAGRWKSRARGLDEFYGELPVSGMADEFLTDGPEKIRAFVTICGNPVLSTPSGARLESALGDLDFMVSIDNYINETTRHADIILPTPTGLEIDHYDLIFNTISVSNNAKFSEALFPPDNDRPHDWQILKELIRRLSPNGLDWFTRFATPRRVINWGLMLGPYGKLSHPKRWFNGLSLRKVINSEHGVNLGPMQPRAPKGLITRDRKIDVAPDNFLARLQEVHDKEFPALLKASRERAPDAAAEKLLLVGRRNVNTNNSWMHQYEKLSRSKLVRCTAMINPLDAEALSIADGSAIAVTSRIGEITLPAEVTDTIMRGVVSIPHGFGHTRPGTQIPIAEAKPGVSVNDITDSMRIDPLTGNAAFSGVPVTIRALAPPSEKIEVTGKPLSILYGSRTGNAEYLACAAAKQAETQGMVASVAAMDEADLRSVAQAERLLVICSTYGDGDMPDNAQSLWDEANEKSAPDLSNVNYSVLALGDTSYETFCQAGRDWDRRLEELGARRIAPRIDSDVDYTEPAAQWLETSLCEIKSKGDQTKLITVVRDGSAGGQENYDRENPLVVNLKEKKRLTGETSSKETYHYSICRPGLHEHYKVGDIVNIIPINNSALVSELLAELGVDGDDRIQGAEKTLRELFLYDLEIRTPSAKLAREIIGRTNEKTLKALPDRGNAAALAAYLADRDIVDLLKLIPGALPDIETLLRCLRPLAPRSYSISSSPNCFNDEAHLSVASVRFQKNGRHHNGVASTYLQDLVDHGGEVQCYFVANKTFTLPDDSARPFIMVGPGTGLAPFRAFLQEHEERSGTGETWLFFGDRNEASDFLYKEEITGFRERGVLSKLDLAFSRDQERKIYVQDRMREQAAELFNWLERGAYFFVCGDAEHMAKDVDSALRSIIVSEGGFSAEKASDYVENLKREKRYVRDVY